MNLALLVMYALSLFGLGIIAGKHGQDKGKYDFWDSMIVTLIWFVLVWWALGWQFI